MPLVTPYFFSETYLLLMPFYNSFSNLHFPSTVLIFRCLFDVIIEMFQLDEALKKTGNVLLRFQKHPNFKPWVSFEFRGWRTFKMRKVQVSSNLSPKIAFKFEIMRKTRTRDPKFGSRKQDTRDIKVPDNETILRGTKWPRDWRIYLSYHKFEISSIWDIASQLLVAFWVSSI